MNEELEQLIKEIKSLLPWLLAAGIVVAGYHGIRKYRADRRAAAAEVVSNAYTTEELEDATAKFKGASVEGVLKLRLAKSYFDSANYDSALEIYESLEGKAPDGFADVPVVGKAQCLEALGKYADAAAAFDAFAEANPKSFLALTAKLGSARCVTQGGDRAKAIETLEALKATLEDDLDSARSSRPPTRRRSSLRKRPPRMRRRRRSPKRPRMRRKLRPRRRPRRNDDCPRADVGRCAALSNAGALPSSAPVPIYPRLDGENTRLVGRGIPVGSYQALGSRRLRRAALHCRHKDAPRHHRRLALHRDDSRLAGRARA